jgi:hypothetical protein
MRCSASVALTRNPFARDWLVHEQRHFLELGYVD